MEYTALPTLQVFLWYTTFSLSLKKKRAKNFSEFCPKKGDGDRYINSLVLTVNPARPYLDLSPCTCVQNTHSIKFYIMRISSIALVQSGSFGVSSNKEDSYVSNLI